MPSPRAVFAAVGVGAAVAIGALALVTALFLFAAHRTARGDGAAEALALWIFWPVLVPLLLGSVALGLWLSRRLYRRALARRP